MSENCSRFSDETKTRLGALPWRGGAGVVEDPARVKVWSRNLFRDQIGMLVKPVFYFYSRQLFLQISGHLAHML
jgi:hypothetical protein